MSKCEICGGSGYHKLSCGNNTARVAIPMNIIIEDELESARRVLGDEGLKAAFNKALPTLKGDEAEEFIRKADENVRLMKQRRCKKHVWRKHYLNGGKVCQVCGKTKEILTINKDVEE
jgi:hypothetical protein